MKSRVKTQKSAKGIPSGKTKRSKVTHAVTLSFDLSQGDPFGIILSFDL